MRIQLILGVIALAACSAETPDNRVPCASQDTCDKEFRKVCEAGFCSAQLPSISEHLENLTMSLPASVRLANPKAIRAAVVYAITPDGKTVRCPKDAPAAGEVAISGFKALYDRKQFNLGASMLETPLRSVNDTVTTAVGVNGPGRVVYVELYADAVQQGQPETGGEPVGIGCVENAPYADKPSDATVYLKINPVN